MSDKTLEGLAADAYDTAEELSELSWSFGQLRKLCDVISTGGADGLLVNLPYLQLVEPIDSKCLAVVNLATVSSTELRQLLPVVQLLARKTGDKLVGSWEMLIDVVEQASPIVVAAREQMDNQ